MLVKDGSGVLVGFSVGVTVLTELGDSEGSGEDVILELSTAVFVFKTDCDGEPDCDTTGDVVIDWSGVLVGFSVGVPVLIAVCDGVASVDADSVELATAVFELDTLEEEELEAAEEEEEDTVCVLLIAEDALFEEDKVAVLVTVLLAD